MNEDDRKKYIEELMQPHIPLRVLQEIRQEIDNIDEVALFKETILEILDKRIKEYTE